MRFKGRFSTVCWICIKSWHGFGGVNKNLFKVEIRDDVSNFLPLATKYGIQALVLDVCQERILPSGFQFLPLKVSDRSLVLLINVARSFALDNKFWKNNFQIAVQCSPCKSGCRLPSSLSACRTWTSRSGSCGWSPSGPPCGGQAPSFSRPGSRSDPVVGILG